MFTALIIKTGILQWGDKIQQDIYEAYQWAIAAGLASKDNACIMGGSFGAYSALQSAIEYPKTYRCAIGYAGVYDLNLMFNEGNIKNIYEGKAYLEDTLGYDETIRMKMSPVYHANNIEIPLFIAHGKKDEQVPFEHVARLRAALDEAKKSYTWHKFSRESYGFFDPDNHAEYMKNVLDFLNKNI
ncbi:prolyl oligopeptidase family serine peptidase [Colwellia sp. Arc7-D]|uniref:alpha/beta hydrolase family protein n=1 Tax=Colwellia sp. Arc7-D TaxID=2161872 RepID=UPI0013A550E7|nr:prolyl oligopeptidase family serine peptidase [Colwellia sp. Arc7-D]